MKKIIFLSIALALVLSARENPFSPQDDTKELRPEPLPPKIQIQKPVQVLKKIKIKEPRKVLPIPAPVVVKKTIVKPKPKPKAVVKIKPTPKPKNKVKKPKVTKTISKPKIIYNGTFSKVKRYKNTIQIITKDTKLQNLKLTHPNRLAFDFERFDVVPPFSKKIKSRYVKNLKVGHHDYFYRITLNLAKNYRYKITKKPYGYLVKLY